MQAYGISRFAAAAAVVMTVSPPGHAQQAGTEDAVLAVPNVALTFAPGYLAQDLGLFTKRGLNVKSVVIASGSDGDPPDMYPFGHNVFVARPETCGRRKSVCVKLG